MRFHAGFAIAVLLLSPVIGSVASTLVIAAAVLGCVYILASGRRARVPPRPVLWTGGAMAAFFIAEALSGAVNWNGLATLREIGENFIFLALVPLYVLFANRREELVRDVAGAAPWCALAALAVALFQQFVLDFRPQGGAGNAAIFAVTVAILLAFNLANAMRGNSPGGSALAAAGVLAAAATLILSQTRALWPCLVLFPAVMWLATRNANPDRRLAKAAAIAGACVVIVLLAMGQTIGDRARQAMSDMRGLEAGDYTTPIGKRVAIWQVAIAAIGERPLLGHGPDAPRRLMEERTAAISGETIAFSHFHNVVLNEMVRAGLVGLAALVSMFAVPLAAAFAARRNGIAPGDATAATGTGLLVCVQAAFLLSGSVGIMLDHDIMDTQFLAGTAFCLFAVFGRGGEPRAAMADRQQSA